MTAPTAPVSERVAAERAAYLRRLGWQGDPAAVEWVDVPVSWLEDGDADAAGDTPEPIDPCMGSGAFLGAYYTPAAVLALIEGSEE